VAAPGELDKSLGEFWVSNPWEIAANGHNLSAYERNRVYLNAGGGKFVEVSHLTGADSDGDGRAVVAADLRNVGRPDLLVRQAGGGPLFLYENRLPDKRWLTVSLRGDKSNRRGIGARLTAEVNGRKLVRELFPANGFLSQSPAHVQFGLDAAAVVDRLTVRWPSGKVQVFEKLAADRHIVLDEAKDGQVETVTPGQMIPP
jgi:hypothetical protein